MSWKIRIEKAKPNPAGKDKDKDTPKPEQLMGEWVDLKNVGDGSVKLSTLNLANTHFDKNCKVTERVVIYWTGSGDQTLAVGQTVRVHTGKASQSGSMKSEDRSGPDIHAYAEKGNFVLNNDCGDTLTVRWQGESWHTEDEAAYDANPKEGAVLTRSGNKLI
jgi:hypothetical protein